MDFYDEHGTPDLQKLVALFGRYDLITPEAWAAWDLATEQYRQRLRAPPSKQGESDG
jgi:hypothetical protein